MKTVLIWIGLLVMRVIAEEDHPPQSDSLMFVVDGTSPNLNVIAESIDRIINSINLHGSYYLVSVCGLKYNENLNQTPKSYTINERKNLLADVLAIEKINCTNGGHILKALSVALSSEPNQVYAFTHGNKSSVENLTLQADVMEKSFIKNTPITIFHSGPPNPKNDLVFSNLAAITNGLWFSTNPDKVSPVSALNTDIFISETFNI